MVREVTLMAVACLLVYIQNVISYRDYRDKGQLCPPEDTCQVPLQDSLDLVYGALPFRLLARIAER